MISDLDIIRDIMVKKFNSFPDRQQVRFISFKPFDAVLTRLTGDHWKHVRNTLSPTFSSGKLKRMMPAVQRVNESLIKLLKMKAESGEPVELKELSGAYCMDVIAGAAFGIHVDSLHNPKEQFVTHGRNIIKPRILVIILFFIWPRVLSLLEKIGFSIVPRASLDFFSSFIDSTLKECRQETEKHGDFLRLLVEAELEAKRDQQSPIDAEIDHGHQLKTSTDWTRKGLTEEEIASNAFLFLLAGYETVATTLSFTLFCLAAHPEHMQKVQQEVDAKLNKKSADYTSASELTYLEMCINEALRLFPPGFIVNRDANEDVEIRGIHIPKGMTVNIPVYVIHRDPDIWPDPLNFDPERHSPEAKASRHPFSFLPFGMGPRNCIGMRFALLEIKMAIASILQNFTPVMCEKSVYPPKLSKAGRMMAVDGLWVKFEPRS